MCQKMAAVDGQIGNGCQCPQVGCLPCRLVGIGWPGVDTGSEVFDLFNVVTRQENATKLINIKPLEGGPSDCTEVEIEGVMTTSI